MNDEKLALGVASRLANSATRARNTSHTSEAETTARKFDSEAMAICRLCEEWNHYRTKLLKMAEIFSLAESKAAIDLVEEIRRVVR